MKLVARMCLIVLLAAAVQLARADSGEIAPPVPSTQPPQNLQAAPKAISAAPSPPPTSQPTSRPSLPPEYAVLQTRNIFKHGPSKPGGPGAPGGPEASFVLKGIVEAEAKYTAFIEDKNAKSVTPVGIGGAIALGKIKSINLDAIEYEAAAGGTRRIEVGRNLMGEVVPPTPPPSTKPTATPGPGGPGQPGQPGGPPQPGQPGRGRKGGGPPPEASGEAQPVAVPAQ